MIPDTRTLVINLGSAELRRRTVSETLTRHGIGFDLVPAVDGRGKPPGFSPLYSDLRARLWYGHALSGAEVGCFLSQIRALETFLAGPARFGLILEDDAQLDAGGASALRAISGWLQARKKDGWHALHLSGRPSKSGYAVAVRDAPDFGAAGELRHAYEFPLGAAAILWSRPGAEFILGRARTIAASVDNFYRCEMATRGIGLCLENPLFGISGLASQILPPDRSGRRKDRWFALRSRARKNRWRRAARLRMRFGKDRSGLFR